MKPPLAPHLTRGAAASWLKGLRVFRAEDFRQEVFRRLRSVLFIASCVDAVAKTSRYFGSLDWLSVEDVPAFQVHLLSSGISPRR